MWARLKFILFFIFTLLITTNLDAFGDEEDRRDLGFMNRYMITTDAQDFEVILSANFNVLSYGFNTNNETLQFNIETNL